MQIVLLSQPPELQEVMTRGKEQKKHRKQKKLEKFLCWRRALQIGEACPETRDSHEDCTTSPSGLICLLSPLEPCFPEVVSISSFSRGERRQQKAGSRPGRGLELFSVAAELCSDTPADGKWRLIKSLHLKKAPFSI